MSIHRFGIALAALVLAGPTAAAGGGFRDTLDMPALTSPLASKSLLNGLAAAGKRIVAVGQRGHIVYSDDAGKTWQQARVPVSSDLVAVHFPSPQQGWAVGHDGVILHSTDAGATWTKQFDGRSLNPAVTAYYAAQLSSGLLGNNAEAAAIVEGAGRLAAQGAENSFLDVWFADNQNGFVVGAFNLIFHTTDGGRTWEPWFHRTDNPNGLHLYSVRGVQGNVYITGEQGLVLKLDTAAGRFRALETPYRGTYFGVTGGNDAVVVFGLRGNAYRSVDGGRSWQKVHTSVEEGLTGGAVDGKDRLFLVSQSGRLLVSDDGGQNFAPRKLDSVTPASAVLPVGDRAVAIAGGRGVRTQLLQ